MPRLFVCVFVILGHYIVCKPTGGSSFQRKLESRPVHLRIPAEVYPREGGDRNDGIGYDLILNISIACEALIFPLPRAGEEKAVR